MTSRSTPATVALVFFALLGIAGVFVPVARTVLVVDVAMSAVTLLTYRLDKGAAQRGRWRMPERALHLMSLAGGWPGALIAQQRYRHKTRKQPFQAIFWLTVLGNLLTFVWVILAVRAQQAGLP